MWPKSTAEARQWINQITSERKWILYQLKNMNRRQDGWQEIENRLINNYDSFNQRINLLEDSIIQTYHSI